MDNGYILFIIYCYVMLRNLLLSSYFKEKSSFVPSIKYPNSIIIAMPAPNRFFRSQKRGLDYSKVNKIGLDKYDISDTDANANANTNNKAINSTSDILTTMPLPTSYNLLINLVFKSFYNFLLNIDSLLNINTLLNTDISNANVVGCSGLLPKNHSCSCTKDFVYIN
jgi:hypothetical protein